MRWEDDLAAQWQTLLDTVETRARRTVTRAGRIDAPTLDGFLQAEITKWSTGSHYNGAWLRSLKREHPELGAQFETSIGELRVPQLAPLARGRGLLYLAGVACVAILAIILLVVQRAGVELVLLGALVVTVMASSTAAALRAAENRRATDTFISGLRRGIDTQGDRLRAIVAQADMGPTESGSAKPSGSTTRSIP